LQCGAAAEAAVYSGGSLISFTTVAANAMLRVPSS